MMKRQSRPSFGLNGQPVLHEPPYYPMRPPVCMFPPGCIESIPQHFLGPRKRPLKKVTKDLIGVNPKRLLMSLRSDKHTESIWALNVLTVMLYDGNINPISVSPEFLCLIMEHFQASLSLVFPKVFALPESRDSEEFAPVIPETDFWTEVIEGAKKSGEEIQMKIKLSTPKSVNNNILDLNAVTRTGTKIVVEEAEMPSRLKRWRPNSLNEKKGRLEKRTLTIKEREKRGLPSEFASRLAAATKAAVEGQVWGRDELKYSIYSDDRRKHLEYDEEVQPKLPRVSEGKNDENLKVILCEILFIHMLFRWTLIVRSKEKQKVGYMTRTLL